MPGGGDGGGDQVIYYITNERFTRGLQRAVDMGSFFAQRAAKQYDDAGSNGGSFVINQLKPSFSLSLQGAFEVVTIGGQVSLELTLVR